MKKAFYRILEALINGVARLPFGVLYLMSDVIYVVLYHIVRYRRDVVRKNLSESFPGRNADELGAVEKKFYRNFADYVVETLKLAHISDAEMSRRMKFENMEEIERHVRAGRSVAAFFSHCGNWEWVTSITLHSSLAVNEDVTFCQIYRPLRNEFFEALMLRLRSRFHSVSLPKKTALRHFVKYKKEGMPTVTGFMSDQKPSHGDMVHVVEFLNHPTAVITGTEQLARKFGMAAVYLDMHKDSRGHYRIAVRPIADDVAATPQMQVTDKYASMLQETIMRQPDIWLWTHKRWKNPVQFPQQSDNK